MGGGGAWGYIYGILYGNGRNDAYFFEIRLKAPEYTKSNTMSQSQRMSVTHDKKNFRGIFLQDLADHWSEHSWLNKWKGYGDIRLWKSNFRPRIVRHFIGYAPGIVPEKKYSYHYAANDIIGHFCIFKGLFRDGNKLSTFMSRLDKSMIDPRAIVWVDCTDPDVLEFLTHVEHITRKHVLPYTGQPIPSKPSHH